MGVIGDGWADVNSEFMGAVRLKKLLAGEFEPSGVKEKGLRFALSVSARGIVKERGESVSMVCDDVALWFSIDGCEAKHPFTCGCFCQDITATYNGTFGVVVHVQCNGLCVKGENVFVHWYTGLLVCCFAGIWFCRVVNLSHFESKSHFCHQNGVGPMPPRRSWI